MAKLTSRLVSGQFFTFPSQTFSLLSSFIIFAPLPPIFHHSCVLLCCWCLLIHLVAPSRVDGRRGSEGARNRSVSQHGSISFINIRFSQRDALKANSETSLLALRTKSAAPPSLFTPLSPFTNRYLCRTDCMGLFFFQRRWRIEMRGTFTEPSFAALRFCCLWKRLLKNRLIVFIQFSFCCLCSLSPSLPHALSRACMVLCFGTTRTIKATPLNNSARRSIKLPSRSSLAVIFRSFVRGGQIKTAWGFHVDLPWYNQNYCAPARLRVHACCRDWSPPHLAVHMAYEDSFLWVMSWLSFN